MKVLKVLRRVLTQARWTLVAVRRPAHSVGVLSNGTLPWMFLAAVLLTVPVGCGSTESNGPGSGGASGPTDGGAGAAGSGGVAGTGGAAGSGGVAGTGGAAGSGGVAGTGGAAGSGGVAGTGGAAGSGGATGMWPLPSCDTTPPASGANPQGECTAGGWCFESPIPRTLEIQSLWGSSSNDVWVGALEGTYHFDGATWIRVSTTQGPLWGVAANNIWQLTANGIRHFDGNLWAIESLITPLNALHGSSADDVWAVGDGGLLVHRDATGWEVVPGFTNNDLRGVWVAAQDDVWILGETGELFHRVGTTSTSLLPAGWSQARAAWSASASDVWIGGRTSSGWGRLARFDGNTVTETPLPNGTGAVESIWGFGAHDVWFGARGEVLHWDGATLSSVPWVDPNTVKYLWGANASDIWGAGGSPLRLAHYGGNAWNAPGVAVGSLNDVWGNGSGDLWAVGDGGLTAHYDGGTWTVSAAPTPWELRAVVGGPGEAFAVDTAGSLFWNSGPGWSQVANTGTSLAAAQAIGPGAVLVAGDDYVGRFESGKLTALPSYPVNIQGVWGSAPNDIWVAGLNGVGHWNGAQWTDVSLSSVTSHTGFSRVVGIAPNDLYVLNYFSVYHYANGQWTEVGGIPPNPFDLWACGTSVWVATPYGGVVRVQGDSVVQSYGPAKATLRGIWAASPSYLVGVGNTGTIVRLTN